MTGFEKISESALRCFRWLILGDEDVKDCNLSDTERKIIEKYSDVDVLQRELDLFDSIDNSKAYLKFVESVRKSARERRAKLLRRTFIGVSAAAVILLLIVAGGVFGGGDDVTVVNKYALAESEKVLLITSEGETYSTSGEIKVEDEKVVAEKSKLISTERDYAEQAKINELITPAGVRQKITLPDGSIVWLNAASSLKFPTNFDDTVRVVKLCGEAYFDVVKSSRPFVVKIENASIMVYGTTFNISSYQSASLSNVSLYTGSIGLKTERSSIKLIPGHYVEIDNMTQLISDPEENFSDSPDWMRGRMEFLSQPLGKVFEVIGRWYGVNYEISPEIRNLEVTIMISDKTSLEELSELLEMTQNISILNENNKLVITKH